MGGVFIVAPTAEERYKAWFDVMGVCRGSVERMSYDDATGEVLFHANPPDDDEPSTLVAALSTDTAAYTVEIHPIRISSVTFMIDPWSQPSPPTGHVTVPVCARGAAAWPDAFAAVAGDSVLTRIDILYDSNDYPNNGGYRGYTSSGAETPVLAHHLLMFALASALQIAVEFRERRDVTTTTPYAVDPNVSLEWENAVRRYGLFPDRVAPLDLYLPTCGTRLGKRPDPPPPPDATKTGPAQGETTGFFGAYRQDGGGAGGTKCFVATAAYGSPYAPDVERLRQFRDGVLRRTRAGAAWFDRFYERYSEWSPPIADLMEADAELAELIGIGIVQPVVGWLELSMTMPDAALDDVPLPWRDFLRQLINRMDSWSGSVGIPEDFDGLMGLAAARELAVLLRYGLRDHGRRLAYLERLRSRGALPLRIRGDEVEAARRVLTDAGLPPEHVALVVPPDATAEFR